MLDQIHSKTIVPLLFGALLLAQPFQAHADSGTFSLTWRQGHPVKGHDRVDHQPRVIQDHRRGNDHHREHRQESWHRQSNHHHFYRPYHRGAYVVFNSIVVDVPSGFSLIHAAGQSFYYNANTGTFYQRSNQEYYPVQAPFGAKVHAIPEESVRTYINGAEYFVDNDVYFKRTGDGYVVVDPLIWNAWQTFTISIPHTQSSGFTDVRITKAGSGFTGPQGEFYPQFPAISQLGVMYGE